MQAKKEFLVSATYYVPKKSILDVAPWKSLPEVYKKFYKGWRFTTPSPVHYISPKGTFEKDPDTGEVVHVAHHPIPVTYVPEMHDGIWGGEYVVHGYRWKKIKKIQWEGKIPYYWIPKIFEGIVYSEILDKHMTAVITNRTVEMINKNCGFDHYILGTPDCDLYCQLAIKMKRKFLHVLRDGSLYPKDVAKRKEVFGKYAHYLEAYTDEEIDWYGLTLKEAIQKLSVERERMKKESTIPLKHKLRQDLIRELKDEKVEQIPEKSSSWLRKKIFPF